MCEQVRTLVRAMFPPQPAAELPPTAVPDANLPSAPRRRRRLWELEDKHHCPVVGSCLSLADLKKVARQCGFQEERFDPYRLHVEAVSLARTRNETSERLQTLLERKHAPYVALFRSARSDAEVLRLWSEHFARGEVAGAMWAALTHPAASEATRHRIYADVHMLSHQVGAGQAEALRRLDRLEQTSLETAGRLSEEARRHAETKAALQACRQALEVERRSREEAGRELEGLRARVLAYESGQVMVDMGRRLLALEAGNADLRAALERAQDKLACLARLREEYARLRREHAASIEERDALERFLLTESGTAAQGCAGECDGCPEHLRGRCVLCVGGRTALLAHYQRLAERLGVRLIHHDGGREDALGRLPEMLAASDAVICPTDSVSHAAYGQLKRHCKVSNKPCVLARTSGIAGFAAALARLAEGRPDERSQFLQSAQ